MMASACWWAASGRVGSRRCGCLRPRVPPRRPDPARALKGAPCRFWTRIDFLTSCTNLRIAFPPLRAPELMPSEDLWRLAQAVVAANRVYEAVQEQADRAVAWLDALSPYERLLKTPHSARVVGEIFRIFM